LLKNRGGKYYKRSSLFEAKRLYEVFQRFAPNINKTFCVDNVSLPPRVSKTHLILIATHCQTVEQENFFLNKIVQYSLTTNELKKELVKGISDDSVKIDDLIVHENYNLQKLQIEPKWNENQIKAHLEKNIILFISIVLGSN